MGSWILARNPGGGVVEEVTSPGAFGTFPWVDRKRDLRGIIFMFQVTGGGFTANGINNLQVLAKVRAEIDAKGLPPAPPASPLALTRTGDFLMLNWRGGTLQTSADLQTWTPLTWADAPFVELLKPARFPKQFYRVLPQP